MTSIRQRLTTAPATRRRGRPPEAERTARRDHALDAALAEIIEVGYERTTMSAVAARAGSSKESLYSWFGSKQNMIAELIRRQSAATTAAVEGATATGGDPRHALIRICSGLLELLTGPPSIALNRAAMSSPELAQTLLQHGRHTTGPIIEDYLARLADRGLLTIPNPAEAFTLLYGLVIQDSQIRVLLGEPPPTPAQQKRRVTAAVEAFLTLTAPSGAATL